MSRLLHTLRELLADFVAAGTVSAAVAQHRMPSGNDLAQLGIPAESLRKVHF